MAFRKSWTARSSKNKAPSAPNDYIFAFEDETSHAAAKAALLFSPFFDNDIVKTENTCEEPQFVFDYDPVFKYSDDIGAETEKIVLEKYHTIFTYSELQPSDRVLTKIDSPVRTCSNLSETGIAVFLYILSGLLLIVLFPIFCWIFVKLISEDERLVVFRLGKRLKPKGPGLVILLPFCDQFCLIRLDEQALDIGAVSGVTQDDAVVEVHCSVSYRLTDPEYVCTTVNDTPAKLLTNEARLCLQSSLSHLPWAQLDTTGALRDLTSTTTTSLNFRCSSIGIQLANVNISDMKLVRSPPSPETQQEKHLSIIQKQLRALSSVFLQNCSSKLPDNQPVTVNSSLVTTTGTPAVPTEDQETLTTESACINTRKSLLQISADSSLSGNHLCEQACSQVIQRARPLLKNGLVCKALGHKRMQLFVSPSRPLVSTSNFTEASTDAEYFPFYLDSKLGLAELGTLPAEEPPDVILRLSVGDLLEVIRGRLDLLDAMQNKLITVTGDVAVFTKLRHLLHF